LSIRPISHAQYSPLWSNTMASTKPEVHQHALFVVLPSAHQSPQPKWYLDCFSSFCSADGRVSSGMSQHVLSPKNCAFAWGDLDPIQYMVPWANHQPKLHRDRFSRFLHSSRESVVRRACLSMSSPLKITPSCGGSGPPSIRGSLGPLDSASQTPS